ncbi:hypothetical protein [Vallitalea okinawensis]|uniref:hypothetical protein n=1 Tax=Vallitalea okinawensis TaxID=2078660 RepID=UPI000CFBCCAC|nr:hypothetical protein [Vallitalea okinawensis]
MFVDDNMIVDIEMNAKLEMELIGCLVDENYRILFSVDNASGFDELCEIFPSFESKKDDFLRNFEKGRAWLDFTKERIVESTYDNFLELPFFEEGKTDWFAPKNDEELIRVIEHEGMGYSCFIVHQDKSIKDYLLEIWVYEHLEYKGRECRCMMILPQKSKYVIDNKVTKMKEIIDLYKKV